MAKNKEQIPFPQADDFMKIRKILDVEDPNILKNKERMRVLLGDITDRQVQYYLSACMYLNILNKDKEFTNKGLQLRLLDYSRQTIEICIILLSNPVFSEVYSMEKILESKLEKNEIIEIMKKYISFDSEDMYLRRSQTLIKWIEWLKKQFNECN